jgi:hypothetical protein
MSNPTLIKVKKFKTDAWSGKQFFDQCAAVLSVNYNPLGILNTGLTQDDESRLEKSLGLPQGELSRSNIKYWSEYTVKIPSDGLTLDLSLPEHELQYKVLIAKNSTVAKSLQEAATKPKCQFVITSEESEASAEVDTKEYIPRAWAIYESKSVEEMKDILAAFGKNMHLSSNAVVKKALMNQIEADPKIFVETLNDPNFKNVVFINKLINNRVISKKGTSFTFDGEVIATGVDGLIAYLASPVNQNILAAMSIRLKQALAPVSVAPKTTGSLEDLLEANTSVENSEVVATQKKGGRPKKEDTSSTEGTLEQE